MIDHKHKCIFVHVPKVAGSSMLTFFNSEWLNRPLVHLLRHDINLHADYFKFTFVRNPWDRFVSEYVWRNKQVWNRRMRCDMSFKECCNALVRKRLSYIYPKKEKVHLWSQVRVIEHGVGSCDNLDFIGRFENLQEDFNTVCDKLGTSRQQLPHANKSKRKHYTEYYDDETRDIVADRYTKDIEYFGYEFGE